MFELIRGDIRRKLKGYGIRPEDQTFFRKWITPFLEFGTIGVIMYRFGYWDYSVQIPVIRQILIGIYLFTDVFVMMLTGIKIQRESKIGPGLVVHNFSCIHVLVKSMGHSCTLNQGVSVGNVRGSGRPTIGNNVYFGAGCRVMGGVTIGDNVVVSANSLVLSDVPSGCTVMGVPARIISREAVSPYLKTPVAPVGNSAAPEPKEKRSEMAITSGK